MVRVAAFGIAMFAALPVAFAASFDCAPYMRKRACPETVICATPELSAFDQRMAAKYQSLLSQRSGVSAERLKSDQRTWLGSRNACGCDASCIAREYKRRADDMDRPAPNDRLSDGSDPTGVPADCLGDCAKQYLFLGEYGDFTPADYTKQNFGEPRQVGRGAHYKITRYTGADVEFLTLDKDGRRIGVAVIALHQKFAHARIPYLGLGRDEPNSSNTRWYHTLGQTNLAFVKDSCEGIVQNVDAKFGFFWTPKCYFGRPGGYKYYSFLFDITGCSNGEKSVFDKFQLAEFSCPNEDTRFPFMAFIMDSEDVSARAEIISTFVYWRRME
jgi:uncharacterized protein YecT (DUF1311 family)